ncbi:hypothetical protein PIB30_076276, partial [Stylosanthes scabra]|nr:hypothetical protein [Stylosanthes scabra]
MGVKILVIFLFVSPHFHPRCHHCLLLLFFLLLFSPIATDIFLMFCAATTGSSTVTVPLLLSDNI